VPDESVHYELFHVDTPPPGAEAVPATVTADSGT
jgi:hypothetical protein